MKIEMELKDKPGGRPTIFVKVDTKVHPSMHLKALVALAKKHHPWVKIIDLRIDLR